MPTYERLLRFTKDYQALSAEQKAEFRAVINKFSGRAWQASFRATVVPTIVASGASTLRVKATRKGPARSASRSPFRVA